MDAVTLRPVAVLRTCYPDKFGVPRQSGLVADAWGEVVLGPAFAKEEAVRGLESFSHLWLLTLFHLVPEDHAALTVRPPRLGGNERIGIFASRSPFRPNRLGLSVVELIGIIRDEAGIRLRVRGIDWVDGTPVVDIKPYIPYADAVPHAHGGYAGAAPARSAVSWECAPPPDALARSIITDSIALCPQPSYQADAARIYAADIAGFVIRWRVDANEVRILDCAAVTSR
jgi:tRNA (adenine37-N6)-methyltransferase